MYGRSQGWASNSNAWVVSWSAIHVRNGPSGTSIVVAVWRMFSSTNSRRPGVASAVSSARSYWPRTRWPMNPSSSASWRVVTQRLAIVIAAFVAPLPGGSIWSSRSPSSRPMSAGEGRRVGPDPGGAIDDRDPLDDARQLRAEMRAERGHDDAPSPRRTRPRSPGARPR